MSVSCGREGAIWGSAGGRRGQRTVSFARRSMPLWCALGWVCGRFLIVVCDWCSMTAKQDRVAAMAAEYDKTERDLKALQSVGQLVGEVLKRLDEERYVPWLHVVLAVAPVADKLRVCLLRSGSLSRQRTGRAGWWGTGPRSM